jgi:hypothetical protein
MVSDEEFYEMPVRGKLITDPRIEEVCTQVLSTMKELRTLASLLEKYGMPQFASELLKTTRHISEWQDYADEVLGERLSELTSAEIEALLKQKESS